VADQKAAAEAAQRFAEQRAVEEANRLAEQRAAAEARQALRLSEQKAVEEAARDWFVGERAAIEAQKLASQGAAAEARRLAEQKAKPAADQNGDPEVAKRLADQKATADAARRFAEQKATEEAAQKFEAQRAAAEAAKLAQQHQAAEPPQQFADSQHYPNPYRPPGDAVVRSGTSVSRNETDQQVALFPPRLEQGQQPRVSAGSVFGTWCAGPIRMSLSAVEWKLRTGSGMETTYSIEQYKVVDENVVVISHTGRQTVTTEFSGITSNGIIQLRGRSTGSDWTNYNRPFRRC
jgi:hypothetical protein